MTQAKSVAAAGHDFLLGGGEMGALMRQFDWSHSGIGAPGTWSPALRTTVRILLANRFPMLLWWGPDYISIYNDAYRPILGGKHPWGLGLPVRECWAEIWEVLKPLIDRPFRGGPATWVEDFELQINRAGFTEETHFTVAYSPVPDESAAGGIGGVLATVHEITEKIIGERRITALRDLGAQAAAAKTAEEACVIAADTMAKHSKDIPFALLFLLDTDGQSARLAASTGLESEGCLNPTAVELGDKPGDNSFWPLAEVRQSERMRVVSLLGTDGVPKGPWADPPRTAVVLPIRSNTAHQLYGFLVAGVSSRLRFDNSYRDFLELATTQIATAVANARAYEEERRRAEALAEIDRAKTAFFSNVSHEFRTPLTLMLGPLEGVLAKENALAPEDREKIATAHRNSLRLLKLVNSLLDFSRIEAGREEGSFEPVDLAELTRDLAANFRSAIEAAGMEMVVDCPRLPQPVYVDREMWEKVVLNLLSNAFKFTFAGRVTVWLRASNGRVVLTVADTGVGIPDTELPRIFERFYRVEGAKGRTYEGTGIGLALVQELVKLHGGAIEVRSRLGEGTEFVVSVPFGTAHLPSRGIAPQAPNGNFATLREAFSREALTWLTRSTEQSPKAGARARILVVDDNADMRDHIAHVLGDRYELITAADGDSALKAARAEQPDLVLSDVMMPGLNGFGLLQKLRTDNRLRELPVILISARAGEEARTHGISAGADDYLTKPFSARELIARVETTLKLQRLRRESREEMERVNAVLQLRTAQFETLLNQAPLGVYVVDGDFKIRHVNPMAQPIFGDIPGLIGRDFEEVTRILWKKDFADEIASLFRRTLETGESYAAPERIEQRLDRGVREYYEWRIDRIPLDGKFGVVCYFRDISAQVRARNEVEALNARLSGDLSAMTRLQQLGTRLVQTGELKPLLEEFTDAAIEIAHADMGNIQLLVDGDLKIVQHRGFERPFLDHFEMVQNDDSVCGLARERGERLIVEDVAASPVLAPSAREAILAAGVRAVISTPLLTRSGRLLGILSVHFRTPHRSNAHDLRLLDLLARQAADLIENRLNDDALRASEARFRAFVTASSQAVYRMSPDWSEMRPLQGPDLMVDNQKPMRCWLEEYIHPDDHADVMAAIRRAIESKRPFEKEHRVVRLDGTTGWTLSRAVPLLGSGGEIVEWVGTARDVTARKRADEAVARLTALSEQQRRLYQTILSTTPDLVYVFDLSHRFAYANEALLNMWGKSAEEAIGKNCLELGYPEWHAEMHDREIDQVIATRKPVRGEVPFTGTHGRRIYDYIFAPVFGVDGEVEAIAGTTRDVTDRKLAEEQIREAAERFRFTAESMPQKIFTANPNGEAEYFNRQWTEFTGKTHEEMRGWGWVKLIHPEDLTKNMRKWHRAIRTGQPFVLTHRVRRADGAYRWHLTRAHAMRDRDGKVGMWIGSNTEIHEQKRVEEELRRANHDLEQFAYSASHDLQEPLRSVKIYSELLEMNCRNKLSGEALEYLDFLRSGATRMEMLVRDLLAYTRSSPLDEPAEMVNSRQCLDAALASLASAIAEGGAKILVDDLPTVSINATHLQQLFQNLVGNAIKYRRPGVQAEVRISAQRLEESWRFSVRDNGIGIESQYRERIFGLFKRLHSSQEYSGTGIGLAICSRIVEHYHGRIWVESELGVGSTFYFTLPA